MDRVVLDGVVANDGGRVGGQAGKKRVRRERRSADGLCAHPTAARVLRTNDKPDTVERGKDKSGEPRRETDFGCLGGAGQLRQQATPSKQSGASKP